MIKLRASEIGLEKKHHGKEEVANSMGNSNETFFLNFFAGCNLV
jgi:hypothetical protein